MSLPTASCEAERNFSTLSIIIRKQTSNDHATGKTELSLYSLHRIWYCRFVAIWSGVQSAYTQKVYWKYFRGVSSS